MGRVPRWWWRAPVVFSSVVLMPTSGQGGEGVPGMDGEGSGEGGG